VKVKPSVALATQPVIPPTAATYFPANATLCIATTCRAEAEAIPPEEVMHCERESAVLFFAFEKATTAEYGRCAPATVLEDGSTTSNFC
jgi:hypothetical protein